MPREVLFEFHRLGNAVRVTALDPETLVEVVIMGPSDCGEAQLKRTAMRKLNYMLARREGDAGRARPGIVV